MNQCFMAWFIKRITLITNINKSIVLANSILDEEELIRLSSLRGRSPFDVFASSIPSAVPTPELQPSAYRQSPMNLMNFDPTPPPPAVGRLMISMGNDVIFLITFLYRFLKQRTLCMLYKNAAEVEFQVA